MDRSASALVDWFLRRLEPTPVQAAAGPGDETAVTARPLSVALPKTPFRLRMGAQCLDFHPDPMLVDDAAGQCSVVVLDPHRGGPLPRPVLRMAPGEKLRLDGKGRAQHGLCSSPAELRRRGLLIDHRGEALVLRVAVSDPPTLLSALPPEPGGAPPREARRRALDTLTRLYGQEFEPLPPQAALDTLLAVVGEMRAGNDWQPLDSRGMPGALLELPDGKRPILVGDIHGRIDNLLTLLTRNDYLAAVEAGDAVLVLLGDLVHHDDPDRLTDMRSSMAVLDLFLRLKQRYPRGVFLLLGNHDGFSGEIRKGGVPQGLLWDSALRAERGDAYREALAEFYAISPLVLRAAGCAACHAGPPTTSLTRADLVDAHLKPALAHQLAWLRCAGPGVTHGYGARDVRQLRRVLDLPRDSDMVVGHFPPAETGTVWMDADRIRGHHVLFSARDEVVGAMQAVDGLLVPQVFPVEALAGGRREHETSNEEGVSAVGALDAHRGMPAAG